MQFGTYEEQPEIKGDRLQAQQITDTPLLVFVAEWKPNQKSSFSVEPKDAIFIDCMNLNTGDVYSNVMWMGGAVVDNLKHFLGQAVGVKLVYRNPKNGGKAYIIPAPLEGEEATRAYQWATGDPQLFERHRTEKEIPQAQATEQANTGLTPATQAPTPPAAPQAPTPPPAPQAAPTPPPAPQAAPTPPAAPQAPQAPTPPATPPAAPQPPQAAPPAPQAPAAPTPPAANPQPPQAPQAPTPPAANPQPPQAPAAPTPPAAPQPPVNQAPGAAGDLPF